MAALARLHSSEAFYGCDDPLEAAIFSALIGMLMQQAEQEPPACTGDQKKERESEARDVDP